MAITVRELITRLKFKVDNKAMNDAKRRIDSFKKYGKIAAAGIVAGIAAIGVSAVKAAADFEMLTTQFEVMLGSTERATALMDKLKEFSAATPFQLSDLANATKMLMSFGIEEKDVLNTLRMLGDTIGGDREKLQELALAYGKVQVMGKATMLEVRMIAQKGIPIITELMKQMGVTSEEAFFKMLSAGKVSKQMVAAAFRSMTSEGGMFYKGMEKASKTFLGLFSTMKDNFVLFIAEFGDIMLPTLKKLTEKITEFAQKLKDWVKVHREELEEGFLKFFKIAQKVFGILVSIGKILFKIFASPYGKIILGVVAALKTYSIIMGIVTTLQALWNMLLIANPIGLIITAIGLLIAAIYFLIKNWDSVVKVFKTGINYIVDYFKFLFAMFIYAWTHPIEIIKKAWNLMLDFWIGYFKFFIKFWKYVGNFIVGIFTDPIGTIKQTWQDFLTFFGEKVKWVLDKLGFIGKWLGKVLGIDAEVTAEDTKKTKDAAENLEKQTQSAMNVQKSIENQQRITNVRQQNQFQFDIDAKGQKDITKETAKEMAEAARAIFSIQLKKVLISSV